MHRLALAVLGVLLLISVICNLTFVSRYTRLNRDTINAATKLQQLNQAQQAINTILQDLVNLAPQNRWLYPILEKYGLVQMPAPAPAATKPAPTTTKRNQ